MAVASVGQPAVGQEPHDSALGGRESEPSPRLCPPSPPPTPGGPSLVPEVGAAAGTPRAQHSTAAGMLVCSPAGPGAMTGVVPAPGASARGGPTRRPPLELTHRGPGRAGLPASREGPRAGGAWDSRAATSSRLHHLSRPLLSLPPPCTFCNQVARPPFSHTCNCAGSASPPTLGDRGGGARPSQVTGSRRLVRELCRAQVPLSPTDAGKTTCSRLAHTFIERSGRLEELRPSAGGRRLAGEAPRPPPHARGARSRRLPARPVPNQACSAVATSPARQAKASNGLEGVFGDPRETLEDARGELRWDLAERTPPAASRRPRPRPPLSPGPPPPPPPPRAPAQKGGGQEPKARAEPGQRRALGQVQAGSAQRKGDSRAGRSGQHRQDTEGQDAARPRAPSAARGQEERAQGPGGLRGR
uniref:atherin-like n=1 Tax=Jaculus jaculus TaxID=51337 RepID=UPI001E1B5835|nr:atherin-like [Jaculus jaculus]